MSQEGHWGGPRRARVLKCGQSGQGGTGEKMRSPGKQGRGHGPLGHCGALALPLHNTRTTEGALRRDITHSSGVGNTQGRGKGCYVVFFR